MAIVKEAIYTGNSRTTTLNGAIEINQGTGEILVRNGAKILTRVSDEGFDYIEDGTLPRIRIGKKPNSTDIGIYTSKPNYNVITELS